MVIMLTNKAISAARRAAPHTLKGELGWYFFQMVFVFTYMYLLLSSFLNR